MDELKDSGKLGEHLVDRDLIQLEAETFWLDPMCTCPPCHPGFDCFGRIVTPKQQINPHCKKHGVA